MVKYLTHDIFTNLILYKIKNKYKVNKNNKINNITPHISLSIIHLHHQLALNTIFTQYNSVNTPIYTHTPPYTPKKQKEMRLIVGSNHWPIGVCKVRLYNSRARCQLRQSAELFSVEGHSYRGSKCVFILWIYFGVFFGVFFGFVWFVLWCYDGVILGMEWLGWLYWLIKTWLYWLMWRNNRFPPDYDLLLFVVSNIKLKIISKIDSK